MTVHDAFDSSDFAASDFVAEGARASGKRHGSDFGDRPSTRSSIIGLVVILVGVAALIVLL